MRSSLVFTALLAAVSAFAGFLVFQFAGWSTGAQGVGWGMCLGGALAGFAAGGSGSPTERFTGARQGFFGTYWSASAILPLTPLWVIADAFVVFAAGIAVVVLA